MSVYKPKTVREHILHRMRRRTAPKSISFDQITRIEDLMKVPHSRIQRTLNWMIGQNEIKKVTTEDSTAKFGSAHADRYYLP